MSLEVRGVSVVLGGQPIVDSVDLTVRDGEFVGLLGANGAGKSTLLRTICRIHRPSAGQVSVDGADVHAMRPGEAARRLAVVHQEASVEFDLSVWEMAMLGRVPHQGSFDRDTLHDRDIVAAALERVGIAPLASRGFLSLSGGEKQRVLIARALAQEADHVILDEPTNHLDVRYQFEVLDLVRGLGLTVLAALHDLNLAAAYCTRLYVLRAGSVCAAGTPEDVIEPGVIRAAFGVDATVIAHPVTGARQVMLAGRAPVAAPTRR